MKFHACAVAGITTLLLCHAPVYAAVVINTSYDLKNGHVSSQPLDDGPVSIANGDRVEIVVKFSGNRALTIADGDEGFAGWLRSGSNTSNFTINNATLVFLGSTAAGDASPYYALGTVSGGSAHIGPSLLDFLSAGQSLTFTGYRVTFDVESISENPLEYAELWFNASGSNLSIGPAPATPQMTGAILTK